MAIFECESQILEIKDLAQDIYSVILEDKNIARTSQPGQFLMVQSTPFYDPLLRRAFSVARVSGDTYELLIQVVGRGSADLRKRLVGQKISVVGPLGSNFDLTKSRGKKAILIAGGIGIAPMFILAEALKNSRIPFAIFYGARNRQSIIDMRDLASLTQYSTEDGSKGFKGYVTENVMTLIRKEKLDSNNAFLYACGPNPMLKALQQLSEHTGIPGEVSVETRMACGIGVCMGCPVEIKDHPGNYWYACKDGPVFPINKINLSHII